MTSFTITKAGAAEDNVLFPPDPYQRSLISLCLNIPELLCSHWGWTFQLRRHRGGELRLSKRLEIWGVNPGHWCQLTEAKHKDKKNKHSTCKNEYCIVLFSVLFKTNTASPQLKLSKAMFLKIFKCHKFVWFYFIVTEIDNSSK